MTTRSLQRFVERHFPGTWRCQTNDGQWIFQNLWGQIIGIIDKGTHYALFNSANQNDSPEHPSLMLTKGKRITIIKKESHA